MRAHYTIRFTIADNLSYCRLIYCHREAFEFHLERFIMGYVLHFEKIQGEQWAELALPLRK
jgi:hypothetical protein